MLLPSQRFTEALARRPAGACSRQTVRPSSDHHEVPLTLVTGPANAAKAGEVLGGLRDRLDEEPILVVPAFRDVEHAQRELAERGAVFGAQRTALRLALRQIARRAGYSGRVASDVQRELIVEEAVRRARLDGARRVGGAARLRARRRALRGRAGALHGRARPLHPALRDWAGDGPRRPTPRRWPRSTAATARGWTPPGSSTPSCSPGGRSTRCACEPERWGGTPVFVYGFDDFDPLQLDALETLAGRCGADVSVSLPFEPGREAFKAVAERASGAAGRGRARGRRCRRSTTTTRRSRAPPLHHVERRLFEDDSGQPSVEAGDAVAFHSAGGAASRGRAGRRRGARAAARRGTRPGDMAVVLPPTRRTTRRWSSRSSAPTAIPFSLDRRVRSGPHRRWGAACWHSCAAARSSRGSADDLLAWLRTPGLLDRPELADGSRPRSAARAPTPPQARARLWEASAGRSTRSTACAGAARTLRRSLDELERQLDAAVRRPLPAPRPGPERAGARRPARVRGGAEGARASCAAVVEADPRTRLDPERVLTRARRSGGPPGRVAAARPRSGRRAGGDPRAALRRRLRLRAAGGRVPEGRRARAVPARRGPSRDRPGERPGAAGARGPARPRALPVLRLLLARRAPAGALARARATRRATPSRSPSSWRTCATCSRRGRTSGGGRCRRSPGRPEEAPTAAELERALAAAGPRLEQPAPRNLTAAPVLAHLAARDAVSAGALESFADCPVKWLVESLLRPEALSPDPEQMVRGRYAQRCSSTPSSACATRPARAGSRPPTSPGPSASCSSSCGPSEAEFRLSPAADPRPRRRAPARVRPAALPAPGGGARRPLRARAPRAAVRLRRGERPGRDRAGPARERADRPRGHQRRHGARDRLQERQERRLVQGRLAGSRENRFQAALYMLVVERLLGLRAGGRRVHAARKRQARPRGMVGQGR